MADVNTDNNLPFTLAILDAQGRPAAVDGVPTYSSSDETIVKVEAAADGMSGTVVTVAPSADAARVTVTADADLGSGTHTITGISEDIHVSQGPSFQASAFSFTFGAPVPKT